MHVWEISKIHVLGVSNSYSLFLFAFCYHCDNAVLTLVAVHSFVVSRLGRDEYWMQA